MEVLHVPNDYPTIQAAVNAASEGAIIQVAAGTYNEKVLISKSSLRLHAASGAVLDGNGTGGIGIYVLGASNAPVTDVEISGFEVENFNSGIVLQSGTELLVHHNDVHDNSSNNPMLPLGDATGIELRSTDHTEVSENFVHHNGARGIVVRLGSQNNMIRVNRVEDNGFQYGQTRGGIGIGLTGNATNDNRIEENEVNNNNGWGIQLTRPNNTVPLTGNMVLQNRAHGNQRSGIAIMGPAKANSVMQNDARDNNLSGLSPCVHCNLVDLSTGLGDPNVFERNLGTFNLTDPACLIP
jgi:nitrous oxidase accessory protein NosD